MSARLPRAFAGFGCKFIALGFTADRTTAARTKEAVVTSLCIQAWVLPLIGIRSALAHSEIMELLEVLHFLGNSYRLASVSSSVVYGRSTFDFRRAFAAGTVCNCVKRLKRQCIGSAEKLQPGRGTVPVANDRGAVAPAAITAGRNFGSGVISLDKPEICEGQLPRVQFAE
jgi:hypothetical protein